MRSYGTEYVLERTKKNASGNRLIRPSRTFTQHIPEKNKIKGELKYSGHGKSEFEERRELEPDRREGHRCSRTSLPAEPGAYRHFYPGPWSKTM